MTYYYCCSYPLEVGSVVKKGNWGRICRLEPLPGRTPNRLIKLLAELVFENVRLREFSDRPSRFTCNFLCPNLLSMKNFLAGRRPYDLMYEIEPVDRNAKKFETDWSIILSNYPNIIAMEESARKYWAPKDVKDDVKELLVESDIKITRRL